MKTTLSTINQKIISMDTPMIATLKNIQQAALMVDPTTSFTEELGTNQVTIHSEHAYQIAINCQVLFRNVVNNNSNWVTVTIGDENVD